jgi:hypothetical protein
MAAPHAGPPSTDPSEAQDKSSASKVEWIPLNGEVRGVRVQADTSQLLDEHEGSRPCGGLLDRYVACAKEFNIELCDDEKFLYRKCIREFVRQRCAPRRAAPPCFCYYAALRRQSLRAHSGSYARLRCHGAGPWSRRQGTWARPRYPRDRRVHPLRGDHPRSRE